MVLGTPDLMATSRTVVKALAMALLEGAKAEPVADFYRYCLEQPGVRLCLSAPATLEQPQAAQTRRYVRIAAS